VGDGAAGPEVVVVPVVAGPPEEPEVGVELPLTVGALEPDGDDEPDPPLEPEEPEVVVGTTVTATSVVAPVLVSTSVRVRFVEPLPDGPVTGIIATVELPSAASTDGSLTTSMLPDRLGPQEGATG
jgi:hypothetical protein